MPQVQALYSYAGRILATLEQVDALFLVRDQHVKETQECCFWAQARPQVVPVVCCAYLRALVPVDQEEGAWPRRAGPIFEGVELL